jgi:hypothetical protein
VLGSNRASREEDDCEIKSGTFQRHTCTS